VRHHLLLDTDEGLDLFIAIFLRRYARFGDFVEGIIRK